MLTLSELYAFFESKLPRTLSCDWDNDGMMCCADPAKQVHRALVVLDVTDEIIDAAVTGGYDLILSHHPMIFRGLRSVEPSSLAAARTIKLIRAGVSVFSFHTRLDAAEGGVNDALAAALGLTDVVPFGSGGQAIGRIGLLSTPMLAQDFAKHVKETLGSPYACLADAHRPAHRVAVLGGSGKDELQAACEAGADTYVSGELGHHPMTDAPDMGINLIEAGHFYTERTVLPVLQAMLAEADPTIESEVLSDCRIQVI